MDQTFVDYLNKKSDMLQAFCSCGNEEYLAFIDAKETKYFTRCRRCNKKIYFVTCTNIKCETGYAFPEDSKEINLAAGTWTCDGCHTANQGLPSEEIRNYYRNELPPEIIKEEKSRGIPMWVIIAFIAIFVALYAIDFIK